MLPETKQQLCTLQILPTAESLARASHASVELLRSGRGVDGGLVLFARLGISPFQDHFPLAGPVMSQGVLVLGAPVPKVDILVLGAGWLSQFLLPLLHSSNISYAATTRNGTSHYPVTILDCLPFYSWTFDAQASEEDISKSFGNLPPAKTILITFPINVSGASEKMLKGYRVAHGYDDDVLWIRLGSTSVWKLDPKETVMSFNRLSPIDPEHARGQSENEFLSVKLPRTSQAVLQLAGLWGGERQMRNWVSRIASSKEALRNKSGLHMIHGQDVSQAIILLHSNPLKLPQLDSASPFNRRFILSDLRIYDWWDLASSWGSDGQTVKEATWVQELMREEGVVVLPRGQQRLGRILDGRAFWERFGGTVSMRLS